MHFNISELITPNTIEKLLLVIIVAVLGMAFIQLLAFVVVKLAAKGKSKHRQMIIRRVIIYSGVVLILFSIFKILGIKASAIFGAAGVVGIVLGIASQTSIGNIISGIFLVSERSFEIGDLVKVGDKQGVVNSIDLLSIKLRTNDNLLIRIPNQTIISTELTNITRFPIRRMEIMVSVAYKEDLRKVMKILTQVANNNPICLDEPEPLVLAKNFGESGIDIQLGLWFEKTQYKALRNAMFIDIKEAFEKENIEIPFPHVSIYAGEASKAFKLDAHKQE